MPYNKLTPELIGKLKKITQNLIVDQDAMTAYSTDENKLYSNMPEVVVFPASTQEVSQIMQLASEHNIPVTPRGTGTNLTGAAVPVKGGIVLTLEKMNRILEIDTANSMVVCEPGVININLQNELAKYCLFYPPDPASVESCTIGGNVAVCAGGMKAVKYGVTKDYVLGLEVVLPNGEIITPGGKLRKNVTGYDLINLFIGSEGTLGIITKIILKVLPLPEHKIDLWIPFSLYDKALEMLPRLYHLRSTPAVIEFMEKDCIKAWELLTGEIHQYSEAQAHLIVEVDGNNREELNRECEKIADLCMEQGAIDVLVADTPALQERIWGVRRRIGEATRHMGGKKVAEDIVVPPANIMKFLYSMKDIGHLHDIQIVAYGHLGDGNIHVNVLKGALSEEQWELTTPLVIETIFITALKLGGQITGEHGIGLSKKDYLRMAVGPVQYDLMKAIKEIFDPADILNPGKIFQD